MSRDNKSGLYWGVAGAPPVVAGGYYYQEQVHGARPARWGEVFTVEVSQMGAAMVVRFANGAFQPVAGMRGRWAGPLPRPQERR